jgi:hypothetical protein
MLLFFWTPQKRKGIASKLAPTLSASLSGIVALGNQRRQVGDADVDAENESRDPVSLLFPAFAGMTTEAREGIPGR